MTISEFRRRFPDWVAGAAFVLALVVVLSAVFLMGMGKQRDIDAKDRAIAQAELLNRVESRDRGVLQGIYWDYQSTPRSQITGPIALFMDNTECVGYAGTIYFRIAGLTPKGGFEVLIRESWRPFYVYDNVADGYASLDGFADYRIPCYQRFDTVGGSTYVQIRDINSGVVSYEMPLLPGSGKGGPLLGE